MSRRAIAYRDPTGDAAVRRVMRRGPDYTAISEVEDLGLGYPPTDETDDLRPNKGMPPTSPAKNQVEGLITNTQQRK